MRVGSCISCVVRDVLGVLGVFLHLPFCLGGLVYQLLDGVVSLEVGNHLHLVIEAIEEAGHCLLMNSFILARWPIPSPCNMLPPFWCLA